MSDTHFSPKFMLVNSLFNLFLALENECLESVVTIYFLFNMLFRPNFRIKEAT